MNPHIEQFRRKYAVAWGKLNPPTPKWDRKGAGRNKSQERLNDFLSDSDLPHDPYKFHAKATFDLTIDADGSYNRNSAVLMAVFGCLEENTGNKIDRSKAGAVLDVLSDSPTIETIEKALRIAFP